MRAWLVYAVLTLIPLAHAGQDDDGFPELTRPLDPKGHEGRLRSDPEEEERRRLSYREVARHRKSLLRCGRMHPDAYGDLWLQLRVDRRGVVIAPSILEGRSVPENPKLDECILAAAHDWRIADKRLRGHTLAVLVVFRHPGETDAGVIVIPTAQP